MKVKRKKILYVQYLNPGYFPPLIRSADIFSQAGWQVSFLGIRASKQDPLFAPPAPNIFIHYLPHCPPGLLQKAHYLLFCLWVLAWVVLYRPAIVYVSDYIASLPALAIRGGVKLVYHEHDFPEFEEKTSIFIRMLLWSRKMLAQRATACVLPHEQRAEDFARSLNVSRVHCVWNCSLQKEVATPREKLKEGLNVLYQGSIVPTRLPKAVLHALMSLPPSVTLTVIGNETVGHPGYVDELIKLASELGISERVRYLGSILSKDRLLEEASRCDVGLALLGDDASYGTRYSAGASNKPFEYLASGLALVVPPYPEWRKMFVEPGYGFSCGISDAAEIARIFKWYADNPEKTRQMGESGRQRILKEWHYELQFKKVLAGLGI